MASLFKVTGEQLGLAGGTSAGFNPMELAHACVAFGVFDGMHRGHRFLIEQARASAVQQGVPSVVLTFDVDPDELFRADRLKKLMTNEARLDALAHSGVDAVIALPFTREFAALSPEEFLQRVFGSWQISQIHMGSDLRFGAKAAGSVEDFRSWARENNVSVFAHDLLKWNDVPVSASMIRSLLSAGSIEAANDLLGYSYRFAGVVEPGRGQGTDMGFATANLGIPSQVQAIGEGVYAAYAWVGERRFKAAVSVGVAPTFADAVASCEVHILDFSGDIVGQTIAVEFTNWLRPMMKFESVDVLIETVLGNIDWVRKNL